MHARTIFASTSVAAVAAALLIGGAAVTSAAPGSRPASNNGQGQQGQGGQQAQQGQGGQPGGRPGGRHRQPQFIRPAATYLGVTPRALMTELKTGTTLAAIATDASKSVEGLKDAITADARTNLAKQVAAGKLDQDAADAKLAKLTADIDTIVTTPMAGRGNGSGSGNRPPAGNTGETGSTPSTGGDSYGSTPAPTMGNSGNTGGGGSYL